MKVALLTTATLTGLLCMGVHAEILVRSGGFGYNGYSQPNWSQFSALLDVASGDNMQSVNSFEDAAQVSLADALWVDVGDDYSTTLSANEVLNIQNFVAAGKRVVMIGEGLEWFQWNNQITGLLGGSTTDYTYIDGVVTVALNHQLTEGVSSVQVPYGSLVGGGNSLFSESVASLFGSSENALVYLDSNTFSDSNISNADNYIFAQNVASWIAVPEPSSLVMIGLVSGIAVFVRRRFML